MALHRQELEIQLEDLGDAELAGRAARGEADAFEVLYHRHVAAAWRVAQAVSNNPEDAADAVAEAFSRLLQALAAGRLSPDVAFRPYLLVTTRHVAIDQYRYLARVGPDPVLAGIEPPATVAGPSERVVEAEDAGLVAEAFRSLPERWRSVLWLTEVEGVPLREVGSRMDLSPNGAAQLAHRARNGLRDRYLRAHLRHAAAPGCEKTVNQLSAYVAGGLSAAGAAAVEEHLAGCAACTVRLDELKDIGTTLRAIALPIPVGLGALAASRYRLAFPSSAPPGRGRRGGADERLTRSLSITTAALLALGVITAGLMTNGKGPVPVPSRTTGGSVAGSPPVVVQLASNSPPAGGGQLAIVRALRSIGPGASPVAVRAVTPAVAPGPAGSTPSGTQGSTPPSKPPPPPPPSGSGSGSPKPLVQVVAGLNLSVTTASAAVGVGSGGCTAASVAASKSCAPPAPAKPGIAVSVQTPLGPVSVGLP